jgi:hypothetical protein
MVDFWDENSRETEAVFQVEIHVPSDWSLDCFVDALGYTIKIHPCNTALRRSTSVDAECTVQGQTPSSMGELFFFSCTRHVNMYFHRGIVIHSFILSFCPTGYYFLLVSSGITQDLLTHATGMC